MDIFIRRIFRVKQWIRNVFRRYSRNCSTRNNKKSYRETAKTISEDSDSYISHTAVRNIVLALGEKIKLYEEGKIEVSKKVDSVFCEHDGIYI